MLAEGSGAGAEPSCPVCEAPTVADGPVVDDREPGTQAGNTSGAKHAGSRREDRAAGQRPLGPPLIHPAARPGVRARTTAAALRIRTIRIPQPWNAHASKVTERN